MRERKYLIKSKKQMFLVIAVFTLILFVGGTTYAFFNYTRTGSANTINTGRIYFSTEQTNANTVNLTNIFPMTKEQALADSSTNGQLVVTFNGDTTYTDGIEYLLTIEDVTSNMNIPVSLIMDVNVTENNVAVAENSNYYTARNSKNTSMYLASGEDTTINSTNHKIITDVKNGQYLLTGYIKNGQYGITGSITIKAFIDADKILITDTPNDQSGNPPTGSTDGTVTTGKTVISTTEWNSLRTNGISFRVKGEAKPGIWVEKPEITAYVVSFEMMYIGQTIPQGVTIRTNPTDAMADWVSIAGGTRPFYLKYILNDNDEIEESYVEFVVTPEMATSNPGMVAGTYSLRGLDTNDSNWNCKSEYLDGNGNCVSPYFTENMNTIKTAFDFVNHPDRCGGNQTSRFYCNMSGLLAQAYSDAYVYARGDGKYSCYVDSDGSSGCEIMP